MILFLRNIFFLIILPGSVTVTIPYYFILRGRIVIECFGLAQVGGLIAMTSGWYILFRCVWDLAQTSARPHVQPKRMSHSRWLGLCFVAIYTLRPSFRRNRSAHSGLER